MFAFIRNTLTDIYKKESPLFQKRVVILYFIHLFIISFSGMAILVYAVFLPQRLVFGLPIFLSAGGLSIATLILLHLKRYTLAVYLFTIAFVIIFAVMQFQKTGASVHTGYTSYFYLMLALMIAVTFFGDRKLLFFIASAIVLIDVFYFYFAYPQVQDHLNNYESLLSGFISTMFSVLISFGLLYLLKGLLDKAVIIAQEQTDKASMQYLRMFKLVSSTELFDSIEEVSDSLSDTENEINILIEDNNNILKDIAIRSNKSIEEAETVSKLSQRQMREIEKVNQSLSSLSQHLEIAGSSAHNYSVTAKNILDNIKVGNKYIEETHRSTNQVLENISKISKITLDIHDVAEKVNMLSLNASIEASRAGDFGQGFSVVAEEISKLAERTSASANDVSRLVQEESQQVHGTVRLVKKLEESFREIFSNVENMNQFISSIQNIVHQGNTMSFQLENMVLELSNDSKRMENFTIDQTSNNKRIQQELKLVTKGIGDIKDEFIHLRGFSKELSLQSNMLKDKIIS